MVLIDVVDVGWCFCCGAILVIAVGVVIVIVVVCGNVEKELKWT